MIINGEKWHYLAIKKLSPLLKGITSKHDGDSSFLNCHYLTLFSIHLGQKINLKSMKIYVKIMIMKKNL